MFEKWTWTQETTHKELQATGFLIYDSEHRQNASVVAEVRWGGPGSLRTQDWGAIRYDLGVVTQLCMKNIRCTLDISALYSIRLLSFAPYASSFHIQLKQKQKLLGRRYVTFEEEMTNDTQVIIKRKHQGRVSDFYLGHILCVKKFRGFLRKTKWGRNLWHFQQLCIELHCYTRGDS